MRSLSRFRVFVFALAAGAVALTACDGTPSDGSQSAASSEALAVLDPSEIVGTIHYGDTAGPIHYTESPLYRALRFDGARADTVDITVAADDAIPKVWLLASDFSTLASSYAHRTGETAHVSFQLPSSSTYFIAFREANLEDTDFSVSLRGKPACTGGGACTPPNGCHVGQIVCNDDGATSCQDTGTSVADRTSCGDGLVCATGACVASAYVVGGPGVGPLYSDDDVVVNLNGTQIYGDFGRGAGDRTPLTLNAVPGDIVTMSFFDTFGGSRGHADVWLQGPGVAPQLVETGYAGAGSSYRADKTQPFDILVFKVPGPGETATRQCLPEVALDTAIWPAVSNLVIHQATTKSYAVTWTVNNHAYNYVPDCNGNVSDVFIGPGNAWAEVHWNTITHRLDAYPVGGQAYSATIARTAAQYAVNTLFPGGDMGLLTIH